ncbi:MAG: cadherin domain-containing protein, partial [Desulfococcaceae bacterium]|nr:cadherin domain-containing protein [Desulfococcaceae bacterium]
DPPVASAEPGTNEFTIPENSPEETGVGTVAAFDQDGDGIIYSIADGNIDDAFSIDADTGQITVNNPEALDYETNPVFTLTILLQDGDNPSLSTTTTVVIRLEDVLEEAPVYNDTEFTIEENSPEDTFVGQQIALDPDGDNITYAIIDGNTGDAFSIDPETGVITVNNADMMDYETYPVFTLTVQATDDGSPSQSDTGTVTIRLLDVEPEGEVNAPPVLGDTEFSLAENSAEGTPVGTLSASDPDNDVLTYAIIDGNTDGAFFVNPETGEISVSNPDVLDYETNPVFTLTVQVTDAEGLSDTAKVTIELDDIKGVTARPDTAVTDENTPITINVLENDVLEESAGTLIVSSIDSSELSGTVTLNDDYTITYNPLDSQQIQNLTAGQTLTDTFTYTITDGLGGTDTGTVSITVSGVDEPAPPASFIILPETEYWRWGYKNTPWAWGARGDIWEWGYFRDIDAPWGPSHSVMFESDILGLYIDPSPSVLDIDSYGVQDFRLTTVFGHYTDNGLPVFVLKDMELPDFDFALPDEGEDLYELANRMLDEAQVQAEFRGEEKAVQTENPAE